MEANVNTDFSFAFKRRSASPSMLDFISPSDIHRGKHAGSQSPPPSLTDTASQDSQGSPREWPTFSWAHISPGDSASQSSDDPSMVVDPFSLNSKQMEGVYTMPTFDPLAVSFDQAFATTMPFNPLNNFGSSQSISPMTLLGLDPMHLHALSYLPGTAPLPTALPLFPSVEQPSSSADPLAQLNTLLAAAAPSATPTSEAHDMALKAIAAAGVSHATLNPHAQSVLAFLPDKLPSPPPPKPDLAACPPLAKHVHPGKVPSSSNSAAQSPVPMEDTESPPNEPRIVLGPSGRPKTSHTTIERRYRTNLNARILALRHAVPALRILEKDENRKPKFPDDVVDERGFVDGVKAARKASKASILGKAAEYIHVLKKREIRLRHEAAGYRALISSLVGGPELLNEYDKSWKSKYGGEEMDEVMEMSDGEGDDESEDEDERPQKKRKTAKGAATPPKERKIPEPAPETGKRKRGRPKKVVTPPEGSPSQTSTHDDSFGGVSDDSSDSQSRPQQSAGVQYLLGAFLFFSFFKSSHNPTWSSTANSLHSAHRSHVGTVLSSASAQLPSTTTMDTLRKFTGPPSRDADVRWLWLLCCVVGVILILYRWRRTVVSDRSAKTGVVVSRTQLIKLRKTFGVASNPKELWKCFQVALLNVVRAPVPHLDSLAPMWMKLCVAETMDALSSSGRAPVSTLLCLHRQLPDTGAAAACLSLLYYPTSRTISQSLWTKAQSILDHPVLRMSVDDAHHILKSAVQRQLPLEDEQNSIDLIIQIVIQDAIRDLAKDVFVRSSDEAVFGSSPCNNELQDANRLLADFGTTAAEPSRNLLVMWTRALQGVYANDYLTPSKVVTDTQDLLKAIACLRSPHFRMAKSTMQPLGCSPEEQAARNRSILPSLTLRQALAAPVFYSDDELEDARDRILDLLY